MDIDVDQTGVWVPALRHYLADLLPSELEANLTAARPEYLSDASEVVLAGPNREAIISRCADWVRANCVIAYHGTRLDDAEQASVRSLGLRRLDAEARADLLARRLSRHPDWQSGKHRFAHLIREISAGKFGNREGQVHLTLSRNGLLHSFNHYLVEGSEFEGHVARQLFGMAGQKLLQTGRRPTLVKVVMPGAIALAAANPFGWPKPLPNLIRELLNTWSYCQFDPAYEPHSGDVDCGLMFNEDLPAAWILALDEVDELELMKSYLPPLREDRGF